MADYPYIYQAYPKTLYHASLPACVVQNAEEQQAMGAGWGETATEAQAVLESGGIPMGGIVPQDLQDQVIQLRAQIADLEQQLLAVQPAQSPTLWQTARDTVSTGHTLEESMTRGAAAPNPGDAALGVGGEAVPSDESKGFTDMGNTAPAGHVYPEPYTSPPMVAHDEPMTTVDPLPSEVYTVPKPEAEKKPWDFVQHDETPATAVDAEGTPPAYASKSMADQPKPRKR